MQIVAIITDAYGSHGGIAKFNRDILEAICEIDQIKEVVAYPRIILSKIENLPTKLKFKTWGANSKYKYFFCLLKDLRSVRETNILVCGHINLLPIASLIKKFSKTCKLIQIIHGIEAWECNNWWVKRCLKDIDSVISVSEFTKNRFLRWNRLQKKPFYILPNCVDLEHFTPGPKDNQLVKKYNLDGKKVIMTLGRLASKERYKGFDEVIEVMPRLIKEKNNLIYLIAGDGPDRKRLQKKVKSLGISDSVIFTGFVPEEKKVDYYRLADVFVMPSRGEGFGIVLIEALACGLHVIGSCLDGTQEALLDGKLGSIINPNDKDQLKDSIEKVLSGLHTSSRDELLNFSLGKFQQRLLEIMESIKAI